MAGDFRFGLANGADMITRVAMITRVTAMITGRVAMMDVAAADSRWRSFPLRGSLLFREPMPPSAICHCNLLCGPK